MGEVRAVRYVYETSDVYVSANPVKDLVKDLLAALAADPGSFDSAAIASLLPRSGATAVSALLSPGSGNGSSGGGGSSGTIVESSTTAMTTQTEPIFPKRKRGVDTSSGYYRAPRPSPSTARRLKYVIGEDTRVKVTNTTRFPWCVGCEGDGAERCVGCEGAEAGRCMGCEGADSGAVCGLSGG